MLHTKLLADLRQQEIREHAARERSVAGESSPGIVRRHAARALVLLAERLDSETRTRPSGAGAPR